MRITDLRINHMRAPFIDRTPEFSWRMESGDHDVLQTAYRISVTVQDDEVWNSGIVATGTQRFVDYGGTLTPLTRYRVLVTAWDNKGREASANGTFETAFLAERDWRGRFVKSPFPRNESKLFAYGIENRAVLFEREFTVSEELASARLYASAYGVYRPLIDGKRIDDTELAPEYTPYRTILNYQCYEITNMLAQGNHTLEFLVGDGWFFGPQTAIATDESIDNLALLYELRMTFRDGRTQVVCADGSERCRWTKIVFSDLFMGERVDMTLSESERRAAIPTDYSLRTLRCQPMPGIEPIETIGAKRIYTSPKGETIVDFGQVIAGRCRVFIDEPKGTEVILEHTEVTDRDGNFFATMNLVRQTDSYVSDGHPRIFEPAFTYHGFRYVRISGIRKPRTEAFTAVLLSTVKENAGGFACSDERFNRLYRNIRYSQKSNMVSIPTDCPSREKAGWTGDILVYAKTAMQNEEMTPFLSSWLMGLAADQKADGVVPLASPLNNLYDALAMQRAAEFGDTRLTGIAGWSDAIVWIPSDIHWMTGNLGLLRTLYPHMKRWCDYIIRTAEEKRGSALPYETDRYLWNTGFHFGEWLVPGRTGEGFSICRETSVYTAPFFGYMTLKKMSKMAALFDRADEEYYGGMAEKFRSAIQNGLMRSDLLPNDLQGLYAIALAFDLVPENLYHAYSSQLVKLVEDNDNTLCTGFLATPFLLDALVKIGRKDLAKAILWQNKRPSWLFEVERGATTIWENWFALDAAGNPSQTSYNHYAFGVIDEFIFRRVCGIQPLEPGFASFIIAPELDWGFDAIERSFVSEYGEIAVAFDCRRLRVKIPCNTRATIRWAGKTHEVGSGRYAFERDEPQI